MFAHGPVGGLDEGDRVVVVLFDTGGDGHIAAAVDDEAAAGKKDQPQPLVVGESEFRGIVQAHAAYLASSGTARMTLEGHADERGTREYNLGLGERRSNAVSGLTSAQGGRGSQLTNVSYGEERPAAFGSDEQSYSQNRRVELVY